VLSADQDRCAIAVLPVPCREEALAYPTPKLEEVPEDVQAKFDEQLYLLGRKITYVDLSFVKCISFNPLQHSSGYHGVIANNLQDEN